MHAINAYERVKLQLHSFLSSVWRKVVSFMPCLLCLWHMRPRSPLNRILGGPQSWLITLKRGKFSSSCHESSCYSLVIQPAGQSLYFYAILVHQCTLCIRHHLILSSPIHLCSHFVTDSCHLKLKFIEH